MMFSLKPKGGATSKAGEQWSGILRRRLRIAVRRISAALVMDHQAWWDVSVDEFRFNRLVGLR